MALPTLLAALMVAAPVDLAGQATIEATSAASPVGGKYGPDRANDGDPNTHWASAAGYVLPQELTLIWPQPVTFDLVVVDLFVDRPAHLYAECKAAEVEAAGQTVGTTVEPGTDRLYLRFDRAVTSDRLVVRILEVHDPMTYVGVDEVQVYSDPQQTIQPPPPMVSAKPREALLPEGRESHPCVYVTPADVARARRNAEQTEWGRRVRQSVIDAADRWLDRSDDEWARFLPGPGACYAYGFTGSPVDGKSWGTWGGARCDWDHPGQVKAGDRWLPDEQYPDDGTGYRNPDGRIHYFVGSWNAWVTEQWLDAAVALAHAYALTDDERYADRAALFLDLTASIYPESTSGSWDYPSSPPSGRLARPWYQTSRTLVRYIEAIDLIYNSPALDRPSRRPAIMATWPAGPRPQQVAVGTPDANGRAWDGMTRRENIELNLVQDGGYYCYLHSFGGRLHNGHADYLRGALAAGALLGIPEYIHHAIDSPFSIHAMVANNCDRDGRYYETSLMYAIHARSLYLSFVEPLRNWRDTAHPDGIDLMADGRFRSFYRLPRLSLDACGHAPNFGDTGPDNAHLIAPERPFDATDHEFAEWLYAGTSGEVKESYARILRWMAGGDVDRLRARNATRWLLYHADPVPDGPAQLDAETERLVFGSWFLGQKGISLLRSGRGPDAQAALLRYGPSLNHGDLDDLGLIYYGKGWQLTYEIGYGLGSTHTQVGWASQTASHTVVAVDESSQAGGSGGSLYLFARLPGLQVVEADSPLSYQHKGVSEYRRTVALVGEGHDQVLIDLFRVAGGHQHDYIIGSQGQEFEVSGLELGDPEPGSLAGADIAWGERQGPDGDIIGFPNKPYWNPPPGNGYGFFYGIRRANADRPWSLTWSLGGPNEARFQVHLLPEPDTQAMVAKAPGLYPHHRNASYVILRRGASDGPAPLESLFASVMAPYDQPGERGVLGAPQLFERVVDANRFYTLGSGYEAGYLFLRGEQPGDYLTVRLDVPATGEYLLFVDCLLYRSYATAQVSLDGRPLGEPLRMRSEEPQPLHRFDLGRHALAAGEHLLRFEATALDTAYMMGIQRVVLRPTDIDPATLVARPVVTSAERLPVSADPTVRAAAVAYHRAGRDEVILSTTSPEATCTATGPGGEIRLIGALGWAQYDSTGPVGAALVGASELAAGPLRLAAATAAFSATVTAVDVERNTVDVDAPLPTTGLDGEAAIFSRPEYSRTSGYRIERIETIQGGSRIHLGTQSMLLGRGRAFDLDGEHVVLSDIPHDYGKSVIGGDNPRFFDGKRLVADGGGETRIRTIVFGEPMRIEVESTASLQRGEGFSYYDLGPGDRVTIPTSVWLRAAEGRWEIESTVAARLILPDGRQLDAPATGIGQVRPL